MNLWFRFFYTLLFSRFRSKIEMMDQCQTPFRIYPSDLDILRHMNNGKYFSLQDLARIDLMIRTGFAKIIDAKGWYPVVVAETLQFQKSLKLFDKFMLETKVVGWNDKSIILEHVFRKSNGDAAAFGYIMARFLKKTGGTVPIPELMAAANLKDSPQLPAHVASWVDQQQETAKLFPKNKK